MKTNRTIATAILIISVLVLGACRLPFVDVERGSGDLVTETREVSGFSEIRLDGAGRLMITQGDTESLEIQAEDNIIGELTSEVRGQTLVLGFQDQFLRSTIIPTEGITYTLTVIDLYQTEMACMEPDGVMEQESRYLGVLRDATQANVYGTQLWLRTEDGRSLVFRPGS